MAIGAGRQRLRLSRQRASVLQGTFAGLGGQTLNILVGQKGGNEIAGNPERTGGGGGGSFVFTSSVLTKANLLIAAGGGGGAGNGTSPEGVSPSIGNKNANTDESGYYGGTVGNGGNGAAGEIDLVNGGTGGYPSVGATGGAGIFGNARIENQQLEGL